MSIRAGDLVFIRGTEWTDHLVKSVTHSPYSHVAGIVAENKLIEAQAFRRTGYRDFEVYAPFKKLNVNNIQIVVFNNYLFSGLVSMMCVVK